MRIKTYKHRPRQTLVSTLLAAGIVMILCGQSGHAQDAGGEKKVKNPFAKEEPKPQPVRKDFLVGVFLDQSMTVRIELASEKSYKGTILTGQDLYPFEGKRKGDDLSGMFTVEKIDFPFSATIKRDVLIFRTANRDFKLPRRGTKLPVVGQTPKVDPSKVTPPPADLQPQKVGSFDDHGRPQNRLWLKFGDGVFADFEVVHTTSGKIPNISRMRYSVDKLENKAVMLDVSIYHDGDWNSLRKSIWLQGSRSLASLGLTEGKRRIEKFEVGESTLDCKVTEYKFARVGENPISMELEVWRCDKVALPLHAIAIGPLVLATESDMVAIRCRTDAGGLTTDTKFQVSEFKKEAIVGSWKINCVAMTGTTEVRRADGDYHAQYSKWISNEVPGGVVRHIESVRQKSVVHYRTQKLVVFGRITEDE